MNPITIIDYAEQLVMSAGTDSSLVRNLLFGGIVGVGTSMLITAVSTAASTILLVGGLGAIITSIIVGIKKGLTCAIETATMLSKLNLVVEQLAIKSEPVSR